MADGSWGKDLLIGITLFSCIIFITTAQNNDTRYIGCYRKDDVRDKGLSNETSRVQGQMTVDACARACFQRSYLLSGLLNGNQCFCTNITVYGLSACEGCCQMPCEGNSSLTCGGPNVFEIFEAVVDRRYLGCYQDSRGSRIFEKQQFKKERTTDNCVQHCAEQNFSLSGTQYKRECFCGHDGYEKYGKCITNSNCTCNTRCLGNQTEICGGVVAMSVYRTECREVGRWGSTCSYNCHCKDGHSCNITTGRCPNGECAAGWHGSACNETCDTGKYGENCGETCDQCSEQACDRFNGHCNTSCAEGWKNFPHCDQECKDGTFGLECEKQCNCLDSAPCNKSSGFCPYDQCAPGINNTDKTCQTECQAGTYGLSCAQICIIECPNCHKKTGICEKDPPNTGLIAGVVIFITALLLLHGLAVFHCRRKNISISMLFKRTVQEESKFSFSQEIDIYENANQSGSPMVIRLECLESVVLAQKKNQLPFHEEYEVLDKGNNEDQVGHLPGNKQKNRFKNIIPYDSARVKLSIMNDNPLTDYINASYINGYKKKRQFIACQAPTPKTLVDFWRMLWEQNIEHIVILTQLVEGAKVKCTKYWSDEGQSLCVGDITIETLKEEVFQDYTLRKLQVEKDNMVRCLTQMHYTAWKDYSVPDNGNTMLHFHLKVMEKVPSADNGPPIVVHCSAGVGRTGTFIALDYLLEQAKKEGSIDVFNCMEKMRTARTNMVNNRAQYEYLYDTMLEWYTVGMTAVDISDFQSLFDDTTTIQKQFQLLENIRKNSIKNLTDLTGSEGQNKAKNRNTRILPDVCSQVRLMTDAETFGDYINAVFVDGYQKRNAFIATQLPLPHTRSDLWRMVWDYKLSIIVCFCSGPKDFYWPEVGSKLEVGSFLLETKSDLEVSDEIIAYDITMMNEGKLHTMKILTLCNFKKNEKKIPDLLEINNTVQKWQQSLGCSTILVQCLYGVEMCGIFIAVSNLLKMINTEREVDVFQCVKKMRGQRPEFIQNLEEYQFLYQIMHQYLRNDSSLYMNFVMH